ncbi:MAG TPA: asparagine synthase C-terminal domain-containing protein [Acidobacteriota bacterium]|jgi:asparagine synthase (glutamine-hydrolysing)|nr:asparagine synthase C-terminal domain-containing protein [Acidobacteriota bacterium]
MHPSKEQQFAGLLHAVVAREATEALLFSGGLDTSALALLLSRQRPFVAITVAVSDPLYGDQSYAEAISGKLGIPNELFPSPDLWYAERLGSMLDLKHIALRPGTEELLRIMPELIRILESFDPMQLRNSVIAFYGMMHARRLGLASVMTGDGADEILAGYSFMYEMAQERLLEYLPHMRSIMFFSGPVMGQVLGLRVATPYLDPRILEFCSGLEFPMLVNSWNGRKMGKWILRRAFASSLPEEIVYRVKTAIEYGSGGTMLAFRAQATISDEELKSAQEDIFKIDAVKIRDKEQLHYYRMYREIFGPPERSGTGPPCPDCGSVLKKAKSDYCYTCGAWGW